MKGTLKGRLKKADLKCDTCKAEAHGNEGQVGKMHRKNCGGKWGIK